MNGGSWISLVLFPVLGFPGGSDSKESAHNAGDPDFLPGLEDPLEKGLAIHSSLLAWRISWTEEPGGLQSTRSQKSKTVEWLNLSLHRGKNIALELMTLGVTLGKFFNSLHLSFVILRWWSEFLPGVAVRMRQWGNSVLGAWLCRYLNCGAKCFSMHSSVLTSPGRKAAFYPFCRWGDGQAELLLR